MAFFRKILVTGIIPAVLLVFAACGTESEDDDKDSGAPEKDSGSGDEGKEDAGADSDADADADTDTDADADADADADCEIDYSGVGAACEPDAGTDGGTVPGCENMNPDIVKCMDGFSFSGMKFEFPGGYCTGEGCLDNCDCGENAMCVELGEMIPMFPNYCLRKCSEMSDCREDEGYECIDLTSFGIMGSVCIPSLPFKSGHM